MLTERLEQTKLTDVFDKGDASYLEYAHSKNAGWDSMISEGGLPAFAADSSVFFVTVATANNLHNAESGSAGIALNVLRTPQSPQEQLPCQPSV
jgi:hypothetical protein